MKTICYLHISKIILKHQLWPFFWKILCFSKEMSGKGKTDSSWFECYYLKILLICSLFSQKIVCLRTNSLRKFYPGWLIILDCNIWKVLVALKVAYFMVWNIAFVIIYVMCPNIFLFLSILTILCRFPSVQRNHVKCSMKSFYANWHCPEHLKLLGELSFEF